MSTDDETYDLDDECSRCRAIMDTRVGDDPTEVCDHCAHDLLSLADQLAEAARKHDEAMVREFGEPPVAQDETDFTWLELRARTAAWDAARKGR